MLEQMRQNSRSIIIYVLFGILIAVFILSFGPQAGRSSGSGCMPQHSFAVKVAGKDVTETSWRFGMMSRRAGEMSSAKQRASRVREAVMDGLIERELLAQAAAKEGFAVSEKEVNERVSKGEWYMLGRQGAREDLVDENGIFQYTKLETIARILGLGGVSGFIAEQRQEMLAQKYRELVLNSVRVSPEEVLSQFQREHSSVSIEFVKFEARKYKKDLAVTDADVDAYIAAHEKDLKDEYERDKNIYSGGGKWVELRQIFVKSEKKAAEPPPAAPDAQAQDGGVAAAPTKPAEDMPDPAKATANAALSRVKGGEDFAAVARAVSQEPESAQRGGLAEWSRQGSLVWGPEASKVIETLEPGKVSDVLDVPGGYLIVKVEARTDGDPSYDQIKRDLAWREAADAKAKESAKKDAEAALAKAQAGTALEAMFDKGDDTPEDDADEAKPADAAKPADGKDAKKPADAKPAAPPVAKSKIAKLLQSGPIKRSGQVVRGESPTGYVGKSADLAKAVFDQVAVGQLGPKAYEVEDGFVIFKVTEKKEPDMAELDKEKAQLASDLAKQKGEELLAGWTRQRCTETRDAGGISVTAHFVDYGDTDDATGKPLPTSYQPCTGTGRGMIPGMIPGLPPGVQIPGM